MGAMTRVRVHDNRTPTYLTTTIEGQGSATVPVGLVGTLSTIMDNNNRDFFERRKRGEVVFSDCLITRSIRSITEGKTSGGAPYGEYSGDRTGSISMHGLPIPQFNVEASASGLLLKAFAKMNSSPMMGGETLSELGQTVAMLRRPFKSAQDLILRMSREVLQQRHRRTARRLATVAPADVWLEYRYGWQPIILDICTVIEESHKKREKCDQLRLVARAGTKQTYNGSNAWSATETSNVSGNCSASIRASCDVGVMYDMKSRTTVEELRQIGGFRARDIPATIWEKVPYSFVVDWFVNVGDWLQAITPVPGISVLGWWSTSVSESVFQKAQSISYLGSPPINAYSGTYGSERLENFSYARVCNQALTSTPVLTTRTLSMLHQADAMSLALKPILAGLKRFRH